MKGKIKVHNIQLYSHHGCLAEETLIGSKYRADVLVKGDFLQAAKTDSLDQTIDYVLINKIVEEEMKIPSKLLENVAYRILSRMEKEIPLADYMKVKITKKSPPINGNVEQVSVILDLKR